MTKKEKAVVFWSGGKDSAMALYMALQNPDLDVVGLVTTIGRDTGKTSVHEISEQALERQARQTGLPLKKMRVEVNPANSEYEESLLATYRELKDEGVSTIIYGDIFLEDIRSYREGLLEKAGLKALFPLWQINTQTLMQHFIQWGFKALTCCVNTALIDRSYLGRELDVLFLNDLPEDVDPAGENGEFHTFCYDGPVFQSPVHFKTGESHSRPTVLRSAEQATNHTVEHIEIL